MKLSDLSPPRNFRWSIRVVSNRDAVLESWCGNCALAILGLRDNKLAPLEAKVLSKFMETSIEIFANLVGRNSADETLRTISIGKRDRVRLPEPTQVAYSLTLLTD